MLHLWRASVAALLALQLLTFLHCLPSMPCT